MTPDEQCATAAAAIEARRGPDRLMVALAGPPGAGKSTLAKALVETLAINASAALLPMDGFHLDNAVLAARGDLAVKGAPHTFDAEGFIHLVRRLRDGGRDVVVPAFDRTRDIAIAGAAVIPASTQIIVVEGNYLLLRRAPWSTLAAMFDVTVMINPGIETVQRRLMQRWLDLGLAERDALAKVEGNDLPNARLIIEDSREADLVIA